MKQEFSSMIISFMLDEDGRIDKHKLMQLGAVLSAAGLSSGIAHAQLSCPSCGPACGTSCHSNCAGIRSEQGMHIGQHAHNIEQGGSWPPPGGGGGGGGGGYC